MKTITKMHYLDTDGEIKQMDIITPSSARRKREPLKFFWGLIDEVEAERAKRDAHEKELDDERNARIARQQEPEAYTPDPTHPDLPLNQNRVSDFEYHYGDIAFFGGVLLLIISALIIFYIYSPPM